MVLRFMYSEGGLCRAYRVFSFMYSNGWLYWAYRVLRSMYSARDGGHIGQCTVMDGYIGHIGC